MKELYLDREKMYKEECQRLRNLRLIQTRQVSKQIAAKLRKDFKTAKDNEIKKYKSAKRAEKNRIAEENLAQMEEAAQNEIEKIGEGHLSAANYDDKSEERRQRALENEQRAEERGRQALEAEREIRVSQENKENAHIVARQQALEQERERTSRVVKMPRARDELAQLFTDPSKPTKLVTVHDSNVFATTRYHMPEHIVERDDDQGVDAREAASVEQKRQSEAEKSAARARNEREEKARLRGKHALEKEVLAENYQEILGELSALQRADWERKQKELGNIPKGVFAPAWQREQDKNEFQMELERQFEKIYVDENLRKEEMPQPIDARLSEPSQTSNAGEEEDADLDLTLVDEANDINPERVEKPVQVSSTLINKPEEEGEKVAEATANPEGLAKLNQLLLKIRAQKKVMAEKRHREKLRREQGIEIETDESSLCSTSRSDDMSSSRSPSPRNDQEVDQSVGFTEDDDMTSMITATATVAAIGADDQLGARATSSRRMGAIMMSSHNVSSVNEFFHLEERVRKEERRRKVARRSTNTVTTTRSVDLSHASRDPMLAGPRELLNHNEVKLNEEYKRRVLDQQAEELKRVLKQLEEQEAQLESEASSIVNSSHSNLMKSSSIVSSSSLNEAAATASSSSHHDHQQQHQTDEDEEQLKRIEFQKQLLSASGPRREADEYEYVRLIEERKREMAARFGPFDLLLPSVAAAVVNKPMSQTGVSSVDSGVVLNRIGGSESTITNIDKRTAYSSADSGFGAASGSNRLNVVASNSAAGANYRPESTSRFSLLKTPINLAVEQLNSEIQGISKIGQEVAETQQHSESSSESTTDKRRLSQISTSSSSSCSSYTSENHTHHQQTIGLERYDSTSWTTQTSLDGGSSTINQHQHSKKDSSASTSVDGESINHTESERDSSDDDINDVNLDTLLASLLNSRPQEASSSLERRFEEIRRLKEELELPPPPPPPPVQNRHLTAARLNLSTINEVDTPMSERNVKLVSKTVDTIKNNTTTNRSSFTQVSSINPVNTNNDTSEFEETLLNSRNDENYPASQNASSLSSSTTTIESTSTPINQQGQKSDVDDTDAVKLTLSKFKQRQQILFNISLFNSSDSATTPTNLSEKSSSSSSSSSNRSNSKNNATNRSGKSENPSNGSGKKWFDILASDNDKSNSSSNSSVLITGPCSPEEPSKKQLFLNESSCSEPSLIIGKFEDEEEEVNEKSQARLIESITPSSILVDYSLVSLPTPVAQRNKDTAPAATTAALERTLEEIRVTLSPPQSNTSRRHSSEIATKSITTANATTYKRTISQQSLRSQQNKSPIETSSNSGQTSSSQSSSQLTRTTTSKSSKSTGGDESSSPSSLFDRFLKTHSTTNTASVLDEPEISFVSSVASNSTSPTKTRSMTQFVSQTSSNTMSTTTSSNTTSTTASASFLAFLEQQKRDLSAQFEHVSPIDTSTSNLSRRRAHQISTTTPSIQNSRSSASASTRSSLSTLGNLRNNQAAANSLQTAQNDRFTTVSSLIAATNDTIQNELDEKTMSADESSSNQFHDLPPFDFHDNKNFLVDVDDCRYDCLFCNSFYSIHENEKMKPKINNNNRRDRLAKKLFDSYYVDFDGRYVVDSSREVNQLQISCLRHLSMIKTRQHCLNETCHCGLTSKERRIKLKLDSPVRKLEAKKKLIKDNRDKLKQFTSYVNERNRKMFDKTAKNKNNQCNKRR